ncbi:hypothetical protein [Mucilaginibacter celer]|uniref:Piwi domain-containing protein n=1 Tax=Mucilaginibacter celer TaxID=2305508 RepID=A0A494VSB0_9SPHI|nr:hypothetical protein [Mucilaginibacter celer]AYL94268.1 hypothetical protein HYN43_002700 [Mucilaginibacter celer]
MSKGTNIKVVCHSANLRLIVKQYEIDTDELTKEKAQRLCTYIGKTFRIAAVPYMQHGQVKGILTECHDRIPRKEFEVDNWVIELKPLNGNIALSLNDANHAQLMADLYKKGLLLNLSANANFWRLDSPRIFYEQVPFLKNDFLTGSEHVADIEAYRKYEVAEVLLENEGLGIAINVGTAFFTSMTVDDYFSSKMTNRFYTLSGRYGENKGTLYYEGPNGRVKCYFTKYMGDVTLATTRKLKIDGLTYQNAWDYYQKKYPGFDVGQNDRVAMVSFPGTEDSAPVPVPANRLYLRVTNEALDHDMSQVDKIEPALREELLTKLWSELGSKPFGAYFASVKPGFFAPKPDNCGTLQLPGLRFGDNRLLPAPAEQTTRHYKDHFRNRKRMLEECGCFYVPPGMARDIHFLFTQSVDAKASEKLSDDVCEKVAKLTGIKVQPLVDQYTNLEQATVELKRNYRKAGMAVFTFDNNESANYYLIRHGLPDWKVKRLTEQELRRKYRGYSAFKDGRNKNGERNWNAYVDLITYDVLEQLGCLPYVPDTKLNYDMHLMIDVSSRHTHLALSLLIFGQQMSVPNSTAQVKRKTDPKQQETINPVFLKKYFKELFQLHKDTIKQNGLQSLLVLRDGKDCDREFSAIQEAIAELQAEAVFPQAFRFDFVEYRKSTLKEVRIWELESGEIQNALEGSWFSIDRTTVVLATTGHGTLHQGTASPLLIKNKYTKADLKKVLQDIFVTSQMNYASPGVAQRLTYCAKRADDELQDKAGQEVQRIK